LFLLGKDLDDDGGGRHRQGKADDHSRRKGVCQQIGHRPDDRSTDENLEAAKAKDKPSHNDQSLKRQLKSDHEHEKHDAELGRVGDRPLLPDTEEREPGNDFAQAAGAIGSDGHSDEDISNDRTNPEGMKNRNDESG
jgi:hypothetical protein